MFTYLRQPRQVRLLGSGTLDFPAAVRVTYHFSPSQVFGIGEGPLSAIRLGSDYSMRWNANTDKHLSRPNPGFSSVAASLEAFGGEFHVDGNEIAFQFDAASENDFLGRLQFLVFALPASLSAVLPEPVYVERIEGMIGEEPFRVEHIRSASPLIVLSDELLTKRVKEGLADLELLATTPGKRVLAALRYAHVARRLLAAGYSPWEFMAEAILNYSKILEILFGDSRDEQRAGLRAVGILDEEIEARYIPVTLLRDFLDVGHPKLSQLDSERLQGIYQYLLGMDVDFMHLMEKVKNAISSGAWIPRVAVSTTLDSADLKTIDRIVESDQRNRTAKAANHGEAT